MSHLDYYVKHNIAPVRYDLSNLRAHFQRRAALYRTLGLTGLAIRGASVLEVAAGTGQNSLYVASRLPARLTLLEPNPTGIRSIRECYKSLSLPHTRPVLIESKLEGYDPDEKFDVVICENWLGTSTHERTLLKKLGGLVSPGGLLVVTCVPPTGFLPNIVRRALATRLGWRISGFDDKTRILAQAFGPHLRTLGNMTRSVVDWVHDNMLNPIYFDLCLTVPMVIRDLGEQFQAVGVSPDFRRDWRWFKAIHGAAFEFNQVLVDEYYSNCHRFIDYREVHGERRSERNEALERAVSSLIERVREFDEESARLQREPTRSRKKVIAAIARVRNFTADFAKETAKALDEAEGLLAHERLTASRVAGATNLSRWFGRETIYLSLERVGDETVVDS